MIKKLIFPVIYLSILLVAAPLYAGAGSAGTPLSKNTFFYPVRVAVITDAPQIELRIRGRYELYALPLLEPLGGDRELKTADVKPTNSGFSIGTRLFDIYGVRVKTAGEANIYINGRRFRGDIDLIRTEKEKLLVINHLDIEDYISGVLYHEVSHLWPMEVLKAQAIASRTFAVYKTIESIGQDYDLTSDIYSQVYGGRTSEKYKTSKAVRETRGRILIYKNKILPAYFHATCGGHTEDASLLWNVNIPPLKGNPCPYCTESPHFKWTVNIALTEIEKKLNNAGYKTGKIQDIKIVSMDNSGRVKEVGVVTVKGAQNVPSNRFRLAVGPNILRSTNFDVAIRDNKAVFTGRGWGHGVGMCQWGAYYMSKKGFSTEDILRFYYPGATIADMKYMLVESN